MRFLVVVKAAKDSEARTMPDRKLLAEMGKFNEALARAGELLVGKGLQPSSKGARVTFAGGKASVVKGPFPEVDQLVAGFSMWQARSLEEAVAWLKRAPFRAGEVEIRQVLEAEDFGTELTPNSGSRRSACAIGSRSRNRGPGVDVGRTVVAAEIGRGGAGGAQRSFVQSIRQRAPVWIQTRGLRLSGGVPSARWYRASTLE